MRGTVLLCPIQITEQGCTAFHGGESDVVDGGKILFFGRRDLGEDTDRMIAVSQYAGFCHVIALFQRLKGEIRMS